VTNRKFDNLAYTLIAIASAILFAIMMFAAVYASTVAYGLNASDIPMVHKVEVFQYYTLAVFCFCLGKYSLSKRK